MTAFETLELTSRLLALLAILQSLEFFKIRPWTSDLGVWRWSDLSGELGRGFGFLLNPKGFLFLNLVRIFVSLTILFSPNVWGLSSLLILHIFTLLRWLGAFNGGSDSMNLLLLTSTTFGMAGSNSPMVVEGVLWVIAIQLGLSYFKAGLFKIKNAEWRNGFALKEFLSSPIYEQTKVSEWLSNSPKSLLLGAWFLLLFELSFPVVFFSAQLFWIYFTVAILFHGLNAYFFGLNRFLYSWLIAYPALLSKVPGSFL